jgi:hypothetical protein
MTDVELTIQMAVAPPDTVADVAEQLRAAVQEALAESGLREELAAPPTETALQHLPPKEGVEIALLILGFLLKESPTIRQGLEALLSKLRAKLDQQGAETVIRIAIGGSDGEFEIAGLRPGDKIKRGNIEITVESRKKQ